MPKKSCARAHLKTIPELDKDDLLNLQRAFSEGEKAKHVERRLGITRKAVAKYVVFVNSESIF